MADTKKHLTHLETVGLIRLAKTHPELEFMFRHALIRDAAYKSLLREDRKKIHRQVAEAIEQTYPDQLDEKAADLAEHYIRADDIEKTIHYLQKAGEHAMGSYANQEAAGFFSEALDLLESLPDAPERIPQELKVQLGLARSLTPIKGYADIDVERAFNRAWELCQQIGETPQLAPVLFGLSTFYMVRGKHHMSRELAEQLLRLAERTQDPELFFSAHYAMALSLFYMVELVSAQEHQEQVLARYDPQQHLSLILHYGQDPKVKFLSYETWTLWLLGYPDQALNKSREALTLSRELSHPYSLVYVLALAAVFHQFLREEHIVQEQTEEIVALSTEHGFPYWLAVGIAWQGWAQVEQGQAEEGITRIRQGLIAYRATGAELNVPNLLTLLAEAYGKIGQIEEGLVTLAEALDLVEKTDERWWEAEIYRLKGELLIRQGTDESEVEQNFQKAIEVARSQQAKSLELRATVSLSRLWQSQGKRAEARQMLAEIYDWFTEGFDTMDLQEANALLEELSW